MINIDRAVVEMRSTYYQANWQMEPPWDLARVSRYSSLGLPQALRKTTASRRIPNGGVHFSYLMDLDRILRKYSWFAHNELDVPLNRSVPYLRMMTNSAVFAPHGWRLAITQPRGLSPLQLALWERYPQYFDFASRGTAQVFAQRWSRIHRRFGRHAPEGMVRAADGSAEFISRVLLPAHKPNRPELAVCSD